MFLSPPLLLLGLSALSSTCGSVVPTLLPSCPMTSTELYEIDRLNTGSPHVGDR